MSVDIVSFSNGQEGYRDHAHLRGNAVTEATTKESVMTMRCKIVRFISANIGLFEIGCRVLINSLGVVPGTSRGSIIQHLSGSTGCFMQYHPFHIYSIADQTLRQQLLPPQS